MRNIIANETFAQPAGEDADYIMPNEDYNVWTKGCVQVIVHIEA